MPAFSHFFLKRLSARSKFSSSWIMTSDKFYFPPSWRLRRRLLDRPINLSGATIWVKQIAALFSRVPQLRLPVRTSSPVRRRGWVLRLDARSRGAANYARSLCSLARLLWSLTLKLASDPPPPPSHQVPTQSGHAGGASRETGGDLLFLGAPNPRSGPSNARLSRAP